MTRVFLGNIGYDCRDRDVEKFFKGYGNIRNITLKGTFGFVEFDHKDDAEDAIKDLDGKLFNGSRIRIEYANSSADDRYDSDRGRDRVGHRFSDGRFRKSDYRLIVGNLTSRTTWQDLKDFMSTAGEVSYTSVKRPKRGEGLVEFKRKAAMEYALKELDDQKLDGNRIWLEREGGKSRSHTRSRSRSRSRSRRGRRSRSRDRRSRSRSKSRSNSKASSRSRSRSRNKDRSRSKSRSRSRS